MVFVAEGSYSLVFAGHRVYIVFIRNTYRGQKSIDALKLLVTIDEHIIKFLNLRRKGSPGGKIILRKDELSVLCFCSQMSGYHSDASRPSSYLSPCIPSTTLSQRGGGRCCQVGEHDAHGQSEINLTRQHRF